MKGPYIAVPVHDFLYSVPAYYAVEGPRGLVFTYRTIDAAARSAELPNEAFAAGVASVVPAPAVAGNRGAKA